MTCTESFIKMLSHENETEPISRGAGSPAPTRSFMKITPEGALTGVYLGEDDATAAVRLGLPELHFGSAQTAALGYTGFMKGFKTCERKRQHSLRMNYYVLRRSPDCPTIAILHEHQEASGQICASKKRCRRKNLQPSLRSATRSSQQVLSVRTTGVSTVRS
jgi:hypothetical protein